MASTSAIPDGVMQDQLKVGKIAGSRHAFPLSVTRSHTLTWTGIPANAGLFWSELLMQKKKNLVCIYHRVYEDMGLNTVLGMWHCGTSLSYCFHVYYENTVQSTMAVM
jgi:hypothetical protein